MAYTHFAVLPKFHVSQKKPQRRAARTEDTAVRQSPEAIPERVCGSPRRAAREIRSVGGATQTSGKATSGAIPTAKSPAQEKSRAARPIATGLVPPVLPA